MFAARLPLPPLLSLLRSFSSALRLSSSSPPISAAPPSPFPWLRSASAADVSALRALLPGRGEVLSPCAGDDLSGYNTDWLRAHVGSSAAVLRPSSLAGVRAALAYCHAQRLGVVPQGGNTGLVGGGVPIGAEVILSLSRLRSIISFDALSGVLVAEAGAVLGELDAALAPRGWAMPLDLGAKGSCQIGGNVATNAGGIRLLRYGSLHGSVLGLEAVAADGSLLDCLSTLRKDNVGFDLKQLFVGSEGALGVVTRVALLAAPPLRPPPPPRTPTRCTTRRRT